MIMFLSVSDENPTILVKFLELIWRRTKRNDTLLLRKHFFLKNNTFIFISLKKDKVQYFP